LFHLKVSQKGEEIEEGEKFKAEKNEKATQKTDRRYKLER